MTQYAFKRLKLKRLSLISYPDNIKSKNVAERLKNHGINPENAQLGDTLIYAKSDCTPLPSIKVSW